MFFFSLFVLICMIAHLSYDFHTVCPRGVPPAEEVYVTGHVGMYHVFYALAL